MARGACLLRSEVSEISRVATGADLSEANVEIVAARDKLGGKLITRAIMYLISVGTATPHNHYRRSECWEAICESACFDRLSRRSHAILKKVLLGQNGVSRRYLALDPLAEAFELNPDALHARFARHAPRVATKAATRALARADLSPGDIDGLIVSTCTGYLCPGLTSHVSEALRLRPEAVLLDLVGQGCGAALPNLRTAHSLIGSGECERVLSVCVEICSAAFYLDDDPGVLISVCLFGDGAGAVVASREAREDRRSIEWIDLGTRLCPSDRDYLRFEQRNGRLRNILAAEVPEKASGHAAVVLGDVLERNHLTMDQISQWITHAGGREVLQVLSAELGVAKEAFRLSWEVLDEHGNLSSPFVLFVLDRALKHAAPGGWWWMNSFGAGFASHGALLKVGDAVEG